MTLVTLGYVEITDRSTDEKSPKAAIQVGNVELTPIVFYCFISDFL